MSHSPMSRPKIAAVHPSPVKGRPRLDETTAPSCRYPPIVVPLEAPNDLPEAALHHFSPLTQQEYQDIKISGQDVEYCTLRSSEGRKPPIQRKHLSAGVFHIPDKMWNTSVFAAFPFSLKISLKWVATLSTITRRSGSLAWEFTAVLNSFICLLCSSSQRTYSASYAKAPGHI